MVESFKFFERMKNDKMRTEKKRKKKKKKGLETNRREMSEDTRYK